MFEFRIILIALTLAAFVGCQTNKKESLKKKNTIASTESPKKAVVYQVFTRLFGNTNTTNKPWGTIEENGVGKFNDFTDKALKEIKDLGMTHIWYTGVPHHAVITDYTKYGISNDDPDVVKGRAGSPYAVKDYYNVNPDLAEDPAKRLEEFEALIARSHEAGLKVIIDIVPNHVARKYESISKPEGVSDFGENDNTAVVYDVNNNFYYNPDEVFMVPERPNGYLPLGGDKNALSDGKFEEIPSKWTGNGSRLSQPDPNDWYETVKINYGVSPEGNRDFDVLPDHFDKKDYQAHFEFWKDKTVPNSWDKFKDIALYWIEKGVDGFRYDMAEMVPVEFWSYMNSAIKMKNPDAFLLAEVYNPNLYRDYIRKGKMDYLYDKVQLYDTLKYVIQGKRKTHNIPAVQEDLKDIEHHMLHFLENHDEQRIASPEFAGDANKAKPAMVVSATISSSPTLIYFGQEFGEPGADDLGFGDPSRTSIFDYGNVPSVNRWVNNKQFDGGKSTPKELELRDFYKRLLNFTITSEALMGAYQDLHEFNKNQTANYGGKHLAFARWSNNEKLIVVANFDAKYGAEFTLKLPDALINTWQLQSGDYILEDQLAHVFKTKLELTKDGASAKIIVKPLESFILKLQ
ncbi:alpha-amylase family protein [Tamlana sp. 2_MG-2023]|uniref:alpha-amylase family protein n=1 Tax=unclassified Tamlana TaxID=2614803 RepID=UPI0026E2C162|nr:MULTISPECIES: alpha-amylase family protein [unclassified Tamlana]MDO6761351.1 alpha-amylase family protein [Tamlana sp. 2_MG-2023]MDO6792035.1 alpha-amylase family protein [Tamlana sp. 1_MG-2023]